MPLTAQERTLSLFATFVRLRQMGFERRDAWQQIESEAVHVPTAEQQQLFGLLREWEQKEAPKLRNNQNAILENNLTVQQPEARLAEVRNQPYSPIRRLGEATPPDTTLQAVVCLGCGYANPPREMACMRCGQPLVKHDNARGPRGTRPAQGIQTDVRFFGDRSELFLLMEGSGEALRYKPTSQELIVGRSVPDSPVLPDIDLGPFGAYEHGVSRLHASLRREGNMLVLTDLGSVNHTYINGFLLAAHQTRVLCDGDEIRLARLTMRAHFRHR